MKKISILHHLGLGDCIECNGMIRFYAEKYDKVDVFCKERYFKICNFMYRDNNKIFVNPLSDGKEYSEYSIFASKYDGETLVIGYENYFNNINYFINKDFSCSEAFYELANLDYYKKYNLFHFERDLNEEERVFNKLNPQNEKYIFVHDDPSRGFLLNVNSNLKIIKNDVSENIFHMIKILQNAEEIHCMPSSFLCLIDCLSEKSYFKKLFVHKNVRDGFIGQNTLSKKWNFV